MGIPRSDDPAGREPAESPRKRLTSEATGAERVHRPDAAADAVILQIRLPLSSETRSAPSGATVTPTGRPHCWTGVPFSPVLARKPVRKSSLGPGFPFTIGKNTTRYPEATVRFQEPCSATNPPLRYLAGNCEPV